MSCKAKAGRHGGLMRLRRIVSAVRGPLGDDETGEALQTERRAHVENAEGGVGAARDLLREVPRQDREAEDGGGAGGGDDREQQIGGYGDAEKQGELGRHRQGERADKEQLGRDAGAAEALGKGAEQEGARGEDGRHQGEMLDDGGAVEPGNVGEPRRGPEPLQRPGYADAGGRQRCHAPEARVPEDRRRS